MGSSDQVNKPAHYNHGIETLRYITSWDLGFSEGNIIKYVTRYLHKSNDPNTQLQDLLKASTYLDNLIMEFKRKHKL